MSPDHYSIADWREGTRHSADPVIKPPTHREAAASTQPDKPLEDVDPKKSLLLIFDRLWGAYLDAFGTACLKYAA